MSAVTFLEKDTNKRPSETRNRRKTRKKIINKTSYFLYNSLNKSLNQKWKLKISSKNIEGKIRKLFYEKWIPFQQLILNPEKNKEKTYRIKTNNQELLIRKQNESDATSLGIVTGNEKRRFHGKESSFLEVIRELG